MRHVRFISTIVFFCLLPAVLAISGSNTYFNYLEEQSAQEIHSRLAGYLKELRNSILSKSGRIKVSSSLVNEISKLDTIDVKAVDSLVSSYNSLYPGMLKLYLFDGSLKIIVGEGSQLKYRFILELLARALHEYYSKGSTTVSEQHQKLFKRVLGEWQTAAAIAFRRGDVSEIAHEGVQADIYWDYIKVTRSRQASETAMRGMVMIIINRKKFDEYFSTERLLASLQQELRPLGITVGILEGSGPEIISTLQKEDPGLAIKAGIRHILNTAGEKNLYTFLPMGGSDKRILYALIPRALVFRENFIKKYWIFVLVFLSVIIFSIFTWLVHYEYIRVFISARVQLVSLFLLASLLPLSVIFYLGFQHMRSSLETTIRQKFQAIADRIYSIDDAATGQREMLQNLAFNTKEMEATKKFQFDILKPILESYIQDKLLHDYFIFDESGEILLSYHTIKKGEEFLAEFARGIAIAVINYYNKGVYTRTEKLSEKDSLGNALRYLLFDANRGAIETLFKNWGQVNEMNLFDQKFDMYLDVIAETQGKAKGAILLFFELKRIYEGLLREIIASNKRDVNDPLRLYACPIAHVTANYMLPEEFPPEITTFASKIAQERLQQQDIIEVAGEKTLVWGTCMNVIKEYLVIGTLPYKDVLVTVERSKRFFIEIFIATLLIAVLVALLISRRFLLPLKEIQAGVEAIASGHLDYRISIPSNDEFGALSATFNNMTWSLKNSREQLEATNRLLDRRLKELQVLYEVSQKLHFIADLDSLIRLILDRIMDVLQAHHCSMLILDENRSTLRLKMIRGVDIPAGKEIFLKPDEGIAGAALREQRVILSNEAPRDPRFKAPAPMHHDRSPGSGEKSQSDEKTSGPSIQSLLCAPLIVSKKPIGVLNVVNKLTGDGRFTEEDKNLLEFISGELSMTIENFRLHESLLEKERMTRELEIARRIQMNLFPSKKPDIPGYSIDFNNIPAKEVGGDYYDYMDLGGKHIGIAIADVSGKGVPAALLMVMVRSVLRVETSRFSSPSAVVSLVNSHIVSNIDQKMFITFLYGILKPENHEFVFTNAGHNFPVVYRAATGNIESIELTGLILGVMEGFEYREKTIKFEPGDILILFTDGVIEAHNSSGEQFGNERFHKSIIELAALSPVEIRKGIEERIASFAGSNPQYDDITLVIIKRMH